MKRITLTVVGAIMALALASPSEATLNACSAAKKLCVAKETAALLKCHSKAEKPPGMDPIKFAACVQKAKDKFDGGTQPAKGCFAKLEAKFGVDCLTSGDTTALEATVDAFIDDVVCQLDPGGGTCPVATPTPTPTATPLPPTCSDGMQNGDETDVDCGGADCPACGLGDQCVVPADCVATTSCSASSCVCAAGQADCNGSPGDACEVTPATNPNHCGACNTVCNLPNANEGCVASQCAIASCNVGFANCDGMTGTGCEIDTASDANNCGSCGNVCSASNGTRSCSAGLCQITCNPGFANCDGFATNGCEVNTNTNNGHCGGCNNACPVGQICVVGVCS